MSRWISALSTLLALALVSPLFAPQLLAFPHHQKIGDTTVYAEMPITAELADHLEQSDALLRTSPLFTEDYDSVIVLTQGGWRWSWLSLGASDAFAVNRPFTDVIPVNRTDIRKGIVRNGKEIGGVRSLSAIIAHERVHALMRNHLGILGEAMQPTWKVEGYADYVAQESSLTEAQYRTLIANGHSHPAIVYYEGRKKVTDILAANGGSVTELFGKEGQSSN
ncbi:MAG: hypothetical protein AAFX04_12965 [Pseudomonadota bacterium]